MVPDLRYHAVTAQHMMGSEQVLSVVQKPFYEQIP